MRRTVGEGAARGRVRAVVVGVLAAAAMTLTGCVQVPVSNPAPSPEPELSPQEELAAMPEAPPKQMQTFGEDVAAFLTEDRNIYCTITTEQGGIIASPVDPQLAGGTPDDTLLEVPAVYCELVRYPEPEKVADTCHGTGLGFRGGTVLLTAERATYGSCRIGMTLTEAELQPGSGKDGSALSRLPMLEAGMAIDLNGFRCGTADSGVICLEKQSGAGFAVTADAFSSLPPGKAPEP